MHHAGHAAHATVLGGQTRHTRGKQMRSSVRVRRGSLSAAIATACLFSTRPMDPFSFIPASEFVGMVLGSPAFFFRAC